MMLSDEIQALVLLSSLPGSWETLVFAFSNAMTSETLIVVFINAMTNGKVMMSQVTGNLVNEEKRRKSARTDTAQAFVTVSKGKRRSKSK